MKIIISDVHLGSRYCRCERFVSFLRKLPPDAALILNGDIVDSWRWPFSEPQMNALDMLRDESSRRDVIWIRGNNDRFFDMPDPGRIRFEHDLLLDGKIYVTHGHQFDRVMHHNLFLTTPYRMFYKLRILLGAEPMDIGAYVKARWAWLYHALRAHVMRKIAAYARERGYPAVVCGHLHYAEDTVVEGIRYLNTGSWTEQAEYFVTVENGEPRLRNAQEGHGDTVEGRSRLESYEQIRI